MINDVLKALGDARAKNAAQDSVRKREQDAREREYAMRQKLINRFLESCAAIPCPPEAYAAWLIGWITQGGEVTQASDSNFSSQGWMLPTRSTTHAIPTSYGAQSLHLLIIDSLVDIPNWPTSGDGRPGWEWGHSTVLRITPTRNGLEATTNDTSIVKSYPDIEELIRSMSPAALAERVRLAIENPDRKEIEM